MTERLKVLGGPGCGKSFTLMQKYTELLNSGYKPKDITLITFRKSSAEDLISSVCRDSVQSEKQVRQHVGTIHSICWRLGGYSEIMTSQDYSQFVKDYNYASYMKVKSAFSEEDSAYSGNLFDLYVWLRNTCTPFEKWMKYPGCSEITLPNSRILKFLQDYEEFKQKIGKIDFSDMIQKVLDNQIELDTPILMVDEFQDLTAQMYKLFEMWVPSCDVVMIAGDPFQSIYGFWGGSPKYFNKWDAVEHIIQETHRLPQQVQNFARKILKYEGMIAPDIRAKQGYVEPIHSISYESDMPVHNTELHLIRCNYQAGAVALNLALTGKLFSGLQGWTSEEVALANAIIAYRNGLILSKEAIKTVVAAYPLKFYGKITKDELLKQIDKNYSNDTRKNASLLKPAILDSMLSNDPTERMVTNSKLFTAKLKGVLDRKTFIMSWDCNNRKILTIHGSKGLEADAVFLHTSITPRINHALVIPGEESAAEARVWYVGATRAKEVLYLVKDAGKNYTLPEMVRC
ncbi:MAG: ATP-dependent helicase [Methanobacterium sp.]